MKKLIDRFSTFIKYIFSSGLSYIVDISLFTILNFLFKGSLGLTSIFLATVIARIISSCINYLLNKNKVFKNNTDNKFDIKTFCQYAILVVLQMIVSSIAVINIYKATSLNESLIKFVVDSILFVINFFIQKYYIFNNDKKVRKKSIIELLVFAILTSYAFIVNPIETSEMIKIGIANNTHILSIISIFIFLYYYKYFNKIKREKILSVISFIFAILLIFGYSFSVSNSGLLVYGDIQYIGLSIVKLIGYSIFISLVLNHLYLLIYQIKLKPLKMNKYISYFEKHPFKTSFIFLACIFFIYFIAYYPGVIGYDPSYQIKEVMRIPNFYSESTTIVGNSLITQFNPVVHTLLIGYLFKLGLVFNSANLGLSVYTFIQVVILLLTLSYTIKLMYDEKVPTKLLLIVLLIYGIVPIFPFYSISAFKDTYYTIFFILFVCEMFRFIKYETDKKNITRLILFGILLCLFRHNGYITVLISSLFLLLGNKNNIKAIAISIITISLIYFGYSKVINLSGIAPTSIREVLSVPLQQIARLIVNDENIIEDGDKLIIDKIIDYDYVKDNYNPELSDPIKNTYRKDANENDLKAYFQVWFKYLLKRPLLYIEATVNNIYGYFYPGKQNWYFYHYKYNVLNEAGFDYHYNGLSILRDILMGYGYAFEYIPIINILVNIGFTTWIYIILAFFLIISKNKKYIILLVPAYLTILMCVVGPVNTYYRYVLPYAATLPLILVLLYNECILCKDKVKTKSKV